ncbi:hypothetical protein MD484_g1299, partial [Candolleomyces efflorescens]
MTEHPSVHIEILPNAQNVQIGELKNYIVNGNFISSNDQTTLIHLLQPIPDASHTRDRETSPPNSACFPGTRIDVVRMIVSWADSSLLWNTHVLWLYGYVGCGKSAIALTVALKFERRRRLMGSFFFFRNTGDRSKMAKFATTLACQLAAAIPEAAPFIEKAVKAEPGLLGSSLVAQLRRLVYQPFKAAAKRARLVGTFLLKGPFLVIIDGLDECEDRKDVEVFIDDMLDFFRKNPLIPLRFLITSRVEQHIQGRLQNKQVRLENLVNYCSREDIDTFVSACFEAEKLRNPLIKAYIRNHGDWPMGRDKDLLVDHIGGSFIFASALFRYIIDPTDNSSTPMDRLPHTLKMNPGLDTLYAKTLSRSQNLPYFSNVTSALTLIFEPLPIIGIAELLGIDTFEVVRVLVNLQAIIHIPGTDDLPVTMCHTSLRDFLTSQSRSGCYFVSPSYHLELCCAYLRLNADHLVSQGQLSTMVIQSSEWRSRSSWHWKEFLCFVSESSSEQPGPHVSVELDRLTTLPSQTLPYPHLFSFLLLFLWVFQDSEHRPPNISLILSKCIESLALGLEHDQKLELKWLQRQFYELMTSGTVKTGFVGSLVLHREQVLAMQRNVQRVEAAIQAKVFVNFSPLMFAPLTLVGVMQHSEDLFKGAWDPKVDEIDTFSRLGGWTPMHAFMLLKWIVARAEAGVDFSKPRTTHILNLRITPRPNLDTEWGSPRVTISVKPYAQALVTVPYIPEVDRAA